MCLAVVSHKTFVNSFEEFKLVSDEKEIETDVVSSLNDVCLYKLAGLHTYTCIYNYIYGLDLQSNNWLNINYRCVCTRIN